jgi:hypothetical protein
MLNVFRLIDIIQFHTTRLEPSMEGFLTRNPPWPLPRPCISSPEETCPHLDLRRFSRSLFRENWYPGNLISSSVWYVCAWLINEQRIASPWLLGGKKVIDIRIHSTSRIADCLNCDCASTDLFIHCISLNGLPQR